MDQGEGRPPRFGGEAAELDAPFDYLEGDFSRFVEDEYRTIVAVALALTGSAQLAEDITQEAFLVAYRRWSRVRNYDRPGAFVRRIALNLCVSAARRRVREAAALERLFRRDQAIAEPPMMSDPGFWEVVRNLPRRQRQVVALFYVEECPLREVATVLGLSEGAVKAHLYRARRTLAQRIGVDVGLEEQ
jgi:RNA polymerase sigma factor (sigma-70 family)